MGADETPEYTPFYAARHAGRFERQAGIRGYQDRHDCRLIVISDVILPDAVVFWEELLSDIEPDRDLHIMLNSPGGDGETAIRLVRMAQARCKRLTVVLPDQAKSAATLIALGAHEIWMGPSSDLGPVDPQFPLEAGGQLVAAKDIIAAVDEASAKIQEAPETYPLWASLLADVTALQVQQARSAINRSGDLLREALESSPARSSEAIGELTAALRPSLIDQPNSHAAVFDANDAIEAGLPAVQLDPFGATWRETWQLWARYAVIDDSAIYEGVRASHIFRYR